MSDNQPYIGAPVTLISSLDVRYEGTLFTIDPNESTVALQNVRCLGTENRQTGSKSIPASETVYEFIIFRGENIKSINIAEEKFSKQNELNDPSILKLGPKGTAAVQPKRNMRNQEKGFYDRQYRDNRRAPQNHRQQRNDYENRGYRNNRRQYQPRHNQYDRRNNNNNDRRGRNNNNRRNQNNRRRPENQRQQGPRHNPGDAKFLTGRDTEQEKIKITEDFDFEKATFDKKGVLTDEKKEAVPVADEKQQDASAAKTDEKDASKESTENAAAEADKNTEEEKKEESPEPADPAAKPFEYKYDPEKSFFDDLDLVDRSNMDFKARRKIDAQTFGEEASTYKVRRRRRRGGNNRRRRPQHRDNRYQNRY